MYYRSDLYRGPMPRPHNQRNHKEYQECKEKYLRNSCCGSGDPTESEKCSNNGDNKENQRPIKHVAPPHLPDGSVSDRSPRVDAAAGIQVLYVYPLHPHRMSNNKDTTVFFWGVDPILAAPKRQAALRPAQVRTLTCFDEKPNADDIPMKIASV